MATADQCAASIEGAEREAREVRRLLQQGPAILISDAGERLELSPSVQHLLQCFLAGLDGISFDSDPDEPSALTASDDAARHAAIDAMAREALSAGYYDRILLPDGATHD